MAEILPRVLVISNNCFSAADSNGRTLGNYFLGWNKDALAQFFLQSVYPDNTYCSNYFRVTDKEVLALFKGNDFTGGRVCVSSDSLEFSGKNASGNKPKRNSLTMLARDYIWRHSNWRCKGFDKWVSEFNPELILLQAGDFPYMFDLAVDVADMCSVPLVVFNTEGYYFKSFDYFRSRGIAHLVYPFFWKRLRHSVERAYRKSSCNIFSCEELCDDYKTQLGIGGFVIYTSSSIHPVEARDRNSFIVSYCGNLGIGRHKGLIEIGKALQEISPSLVIDVYGRAPNNEIKSLLDSSPGVVFNGPISYEKVIDVIRNSDLLVHVESFDPFYVEDIKYGFSTKIADYLSSGLCFLVYAPSSLACSSYVNKYDIAYQVSSFEYLKSVLSKLYYNPESRIIKRGTALRLAGINHDAEMNALFFRQLLSSICKE